MNLMRREIDSSESEETVHSQLQTSSHQDLVEVEAHKTIRSKAQTQNLMEVLHLHMESLGMTVELEL
jgi:hypothetical protein